MAQFHVSKDPSNQLSLTFAYDLVLISNLKPQQTKQYYFAYSHIKNPLGRGAIEKPQNNL